jgi:hypothetical protein
MIRRGDLKYLVLEGFVVLFGVLLALLVDGLREGAAQREAGAAAVDRVLEETRQNLLEIEDLVEVVEGRLGQLRALEDDVPANAGLSDLIGRFRGYRSPELNEAAWLRLSGSSLADAVDPTFLTEAFYLYEWNHQYTQLDREISRLVYSELFYLPDRRSTAIRISERIMEQQLSWASELIPRYQRFLERFGDLPAG